MTVVMYTLAGLLAIGWMVLIFWLGDRAFDAGWESRYKRAWLFGTLSALVFVLPFAVGMALSFDSDPHANVLCLDGHQEWHRTRTPPMLVGKIIVPGHDEDRKVWVCRQWEAR